MIAFIEARRAGLFSGRNIPRNMAAGLIVGVVALPLAMAFAIASGLKPEQGIYTAIIAGFVVSVFGGSRVQVAGPTGAFIVMLAGITAQYGVEGLQIATLMGGCILALLGFMRLGNIIRFVPSPVVTGFTSGIGVIIFVSQWKDFFGLQPEKAGEHFHDKLFHLLQAFPQLHLPTTLLALLSLGLIYAAPKALKKVPGPLGAMVVATALQACFQFDGVATIGSAFGGIAPGLPSLQFPDVTAARLIQLAGPALAIAGLGAVESLLSATAADKLAGTKHDSNQELIGQGLANLAAPLLGGFTATGAIARTALNIREGGNSPVAGIAHSLTLVLILLFLSPLAAYVPLCSLAAILFVTAWNMSDIPAFAGIIRSAPRNDIIILLVTFFLTVFVDLVIAVNIGVILTALMFMQRMMASVRVERHSSRTLNKEIPPDAAVYTIEGPLFFGAVEAFETAMSSAGGMKTVILCFRNVPFVDISGIEALAEAVRRFQDGKARVILCELNPIAERKLARAGVLAEAGADNIFSSLERALSAL
jgi:SulP family sulfate permease